MTPRWALRPACSGRGRERRDPSFRRHDHAVGPHDRPLGAAVMTPRPVLARCGGQATVEFVASLPLVLLAALAGAAVIAAHAAGEQAGQAAEAGAVAVLQGRDARAAARRALPAGARAHAAIDVRGRRVTVR